MVIILMYSCKKGFSGSIRMAMVVEIILLEIMPINGQMISRSVKIQMVMDMVTMFSVPILMYFLMMVHNGRIVMVMVGVIILVAIIQMYSLMIIHSNRILMVMDTEITSMVLILISVPIVHLE